MSNEGKLEKAKGDLKEGAGSVVGDKNLEKEGKKDKASGKVKEVAEETKDKIDDVIDKLKK
ncbi:MULTISPECIES: CsbD family protein [Staphylococcus intermedius group]|uniref:SigmaB-controlled gene product n=1 Tax=Staphylococcus intermedius NCTC 11048 TaxID=1141106 RepID=A0A380FZ62_STAIN|nr:MULTISPECIES: CsbD family protein [Staphylococcus intermedius group]PCF62233.1 CsbD family protein [Staphylococcus intermedius]PCF77634.1 CsbD family protein [Staphylococcus intermedius]PCF77782.1 CsbD family protein [Staphylococcus intermedius]PCF80100.1 CsbD family protein [Staphylococcus delphini]PCF83494.1 CsbD family protein [Staphylococcus intermedius]